MLYGIILCILTTQFSPMAKLDPKLSWYTLETNHFSVQVSGIGQIQEQEELAQRIAWHCEDIHNKLVPYMRWHPKSKTNIVIGDIYDYVSGWATPFPHNTIFICPTFAKKMLVNYNDWLENLIIHEYTHILHMDMAYGISGFLRKIFGRILLPNMVMPTMFHEGFTIFNETKVGGLGRCNSSYYNMMMRTAVLDNNFFQIDKCVTYDLAQFPRGETPYLYGGMFYQYLSERFSPSKLVDYSQWYSGGIPLFLNTQAKRVYGKSFYSLWSNFKKEITNKYQNIFDSIKQYQIIQTTQLTFEGGYTESPIFSPAGNQIFYVSQNSDEYPSLKVLDVTNNKRQTLLRKTISSPVRISKDGSELTFSIRDLYKNFYTYDDIYIYDITNKKIERLTKGLRATDPDFSPTENIIAFIKNELGQTNLCIMDLDSNKITQLTYSDDYTQYAHPRFSPDGNKIAVAVWKSGGEQDIYIYNLLTGWILPVTQDRALDIQPCWTYDGEYLFFSSDRTNVFNIFAYQIKNQKLCQVTNVLTGAFEPAVSIDNKRLAFLLYSSKGYDVHITDINLDSLKSIEHINISDSETISYTEEQNYSDSIQSILYHYNPFPSILPKFWIPLAMYNNEWSIGAMTYGADVLFKHQYLVQAFYNLTDKKPSVYANWMIDQYYSTINIIGSYEKNKIQGNVAGSIPFLNYDRYQDLTLTYNIEKENYLMSGLSLTYRFSNIKKYPYSISPEQGSGVNLICQKYDKILRSDYNLTKISIGAGEYINLPFKHHILMLNVKSGLSFGDTFVQNQYELKVRGNINQGNKPNVLGATCEYRFPIFWIERGLGTFPLFFKNISGSIFFDWASQLYISPVEFENQIMSTGIEIHINSLVFYEIPATLTIGIASDLKDFPKPQIYLKFSPQIPFLNSLDIMNKSDYSKI